MEVTWVRLAAFPGGGKVVNDPDQMGLLNSLADELTVVSSLLSILETPSERSPMLRDMCAAAIGRCQGQVAVLVRLARPPEML